MKISLEHSEITTGLIRKTTHHTVSLGIQFDATERAIITSRGLEDTVIIDRPPPSTMPDGEGIDWSLKIRSVMDSPSTHAFGTPVDAKAYEAELREVLPKLKAFIMGNEGIEQKSDSFEL